MTGFNKIEKLIKQKNSHLVLGLNPTDAEQAVADKAGISLELHLKQIIDQCEPYIIAIKPHLAFYERCPQRRQMAMELCAYARKKGLATILDVKRVDIADTMDNWARADVQNFDPDMVTLDTYMGPADVALPYLKQNDRVCVYIQAANSNTAAREFQNLIAGGLRNYQQMAQTARRYDPKRIGYTMGSTWTEAVQGVRMIERENSWADGHMLCPGFGRQGKNLEFVRHAGANAIYPISSGLTNPELLGKKTPAEMAKHWRDAINAEYTQSVPAQNMTERVVSLLSQTGLLIAPTHDDVAAWPFLKKGRDKLKNAGLPFDGNVDQLRKYMADGVIDKTDFTNLFLNMRNLMGHTELRRLMAQLYVQMIEKSGVNFDRVASVAYGAINTGDLVSYIMDKPALLLRKERGESPTHGDILGDLKKGENIIMIEDVATTGSSLIKDVKMLRETFGVKVTDAFIFIKRTEEAERAYKENGINMHYIVDMPKLRAMTGVK